MRAERRGVALLLRDEEKAAHEQAVRAATKLRHAYRVKADWNLVAGTIQLLERATTPAHSYQV